MSLNVGDNLQIYIKLIGKTGNSNSNKIFSKRDE